MQAIRQKCRPKHQVLILKCYPKTTKGAVDVKPNSSELSYLLYYATTRRSKVQKVGAFLEKKTASDVWRARIGNVQVTLQILAALIEKAPRDLPLYAPYVLKILSIILRSHDITMVESSVATFEAFCENHDGASLSADQEYLHQYEEIVRMYASFATTREQTAKPPISAPVAMRWRSVGLEAINSVASSEALASLAGRQLDVIVPILLENLWTDNEDFIDVLEQRALLEEKVDTEKLLRRRTSIATVRTADTTTEPNAAALSGTTADADKVAEEDIGVLAMQCLRQIFVVNNRSQIHMATLATLKFIAERIAQHEEVINEKPGAGQWRGWATRMFELVARWTPVQDRYVILVTTMDNLSRTDISEGTLQQHLVLATMIDSLLQSDINLIGLSVMDVLLGLIQQILKLLQLDLHQGNANGTGSSRDIEPATAPSLLRKELIIRLQDCLGNLATHVYYADQISDMVSAILLRLKPPTLSSVPNAAAAIEDPDGATAAISSSANIVEDPNTDGFFSFDTAKLMALKAIKAILLVASQKNTLPGVGSLGRNRVPVRVWEGTQWLLRDSDGRIRKAYVDALLTWLDKEVTRADLKVFEERSRGLSKNNRNDSATNLTKRAVSNASHREKPARHSRSSFLQLLHLAVYENAIQYVDYEADIVLLHLLLAKLVDNLGVNAVSNGLPMIFRLQEDILEAETPIAKIRIGSLCHGYFWILSEKFDFDTSPIGRAVQNEIRRRQSKQFWTDRVRCPPLKLDQIGTPGESWPTRALPLKEIETEALRPFDDRYQMVTLISLSYSASLASPPTSAPTSPGRSFTHPILTTTGTTAEEPQTIPDRVKEQMMSEWSKDMVIAMAQEGSKTVSLNGSRSGTNITSGQRNFLAVNGNYTGGTNSGTQSPKNQGNIDHRGRPASSSYGLVGGLGALSKLRQPAQSLGPASDSSRGSVTRVDTLKRVLSGHEPSAPATRMGLGAHSDASSESMASYDFTASELSYNPPPANVPIVERSASMRSSNERARSKSRDRVASAGEHSRPLSSHPVLDSNVTRETDEEFDTVPPVPPLPSSLTHDATTAQEFIASDTMRKGRGSVKRSDKGRPGLVYQGSSSWGDEGGAAMDLESLLKGIDAGGKEHRGNVARPPY